MTQKDIIIKYLKSLGTWVPEYRIRAIETPFGWIGARGDRNVRELIKEGKLLASMDGRYRMVKAKQELPPAYAPVEQEEKVEVRELKLAL